MGARNRKEFSNKVKLEIFKRAGGPGNVCCEGCHLLLNGKPFEIDHTIEEWQLQDVAHGLRGPLTAADGKLLGKACCHQPKTAKGAKERAKGVRIVEKQAKIKRSAPKNQWHGFSTRFKRKMSGDVIDTHTGTIVKRGRR